jgi:ATP-binding cassette subfamily A (ABC1) protein 3
MLIILHSTISLIRGDVRPDHHGGDVLVEGVSVQSHRAEARRHLGVSILYKVPPFPFAPF